jgi:GT2 family glycosyltransferase
MNTSKSNQSNKKSLLYIIILNYENYYDTIKCINSLNKIKYDNLKLLIVDNKSTNESVSVLRSTFQNTEFIINDHNHGYATGNNKGIEFAIKMGADYICLLNNDTVALNDFVTPLMNIIKNDEEIAFIGPRIVDSDDFSKTQSLGGTVDFYRGYTPQFKDLSAVKEELTPVDFISGACLLFRSSLIHEIGFIPDNYFLYFEEVEWALRAKKKGFKVICHTSAIIAHEKQHTERKKTYVNEYYHQRNRVIFVKRNAPIIKFLFFVVYIFLHDTYRVLFKKTPLRIYLIHIHGFLNYTSRKIPPKNIKEPAK